MDRRLIDVDMEPLSVSKNTKYLPGSRIKKALIRRFFNTILDLLKRGNYKGILEVGCGEGILLKQLERGLQCRNFTAVDIDDQEIRCAVENAPFAKLSLADVHALPFPDRCFDLTVCCEVLEHVEKPALACAEIFRAGRDMFLFSVPNEPLWRVLNVLRLAYLPTFGNPPQHVNHWSTTSFPRFLSAWFEILEVRTPVPWVVVLCRKKSTA